VRTFERRVNEKHARRLPKRLRDRKPLREAEPGVHEALLEIDLAATAAKAGNAFRSDCGHDAIATPAVAQRLTSYKTIILVVRVLAVRRRQRHADRRLFAQCDVELVRVRPALR